MHKLLTHLLLAKVRKLRDACTRLPYCAVSRTYFYIMLARSIGLSARLLF
jgi:hypothetical protein